MTAFNSYNTMMGVAQTETGIAQLILPPAIMIGFQFKTAKGNPLTLETAAQKWEEAANNIEKTAKDFQQSVAAISTQDWSAADRQAYEKKVQEFCAQLEIMHIFVTAVGIALLAYAWALFVFAVFAVGMGTFLAGLAAVAAAAVAGIFTAGVAATCQGIAATCLTITTVATGILASASQLAAAVFQGGSMASAVAQTFKGNNQALGDFAQAQATASAAALANLSQNAVNAGLSFAGTRGVAPIVRNADGILERQTPGLSAVDFDADRNAKDTWNVGGGATFKAGGIEHTAGGHVKYGDEGFAGGDLSYQAKTGGGVTAGGNVEYTDEDGIGRGKDGSIKYGGNVGYTTPDSVQIPGTGTESVPKESLPLPNAGGKVGFSGEHDFETGKGKFEGYGSAQAQGGDVYKRTESAEYGDGATQYSTKIETPKGTNPGKKDETPPWEK